MSDVYLLATITAAAIAAMIYKVYTVFCQSMQTTAQRVRLIAPSFGLLFGIFILWNGNDARNQARESIEWPITSGHVIYSHNYDSKHESELDRYGWPGGKSASEVKYSYAVNGHEYSSWICAYNRTVSQQYGDLETKYPPGASVPVHYSPSNPANSCLEIGNTDLLGQRLYMALIIIAFVLFVTYYKKAGD